jgi:hypothetical protein
MPIIFRLLSVYVDSARSKKGILFNSIMIIVVISNHILCSIHNSKVYTAAVTIIEKSNKLECLTMTMTSFAL